MFRRRDEDEVEYTLQPANRNPAGSAFNATNQMPGQTISVPPAPTYTPNNTPYNPAAHSLAQAQSQPQAEAAQKNNSSAAHNQNPAPEASHEPQTPKETKTVTPKSAANMNTFVPSAIRTSSTSSTQTPQPQNVQSQPQPQQAAKPQAVKVDNIGVETERRLTVGYGISLEGKVSDCDKLVIYGNVNAELNNVKALQISDSGCFKGAAEIDYAEISGLFEGEIKVRKNIIISSTGRVSGKITYNTIEIKPGGKFTGEIIEAKADSASPSSPSQPANSTGSEQRLEQRPGDFNLFPEQKNEAA